MSGIQIIQPLDGDLTAIADLSPSNDDIIQRKAGAWTNRTVAQLAADVAAEGSAIADLAEATSVEPEDEVLVNQSGVAKRASVSLILGRPRTWRAAVLDTPGLVGFWRFAEPGGTVAYDQLGANHGTYENSPAFGVAGPIAGDRSTGVTLASGSSQYVSIPDANSLDLGDTFTVMLWFKPGGTGNHGLYSKGAGTSVALRRTSGLALMAEKQGTQTIMASTVGMETTGTWYHGAFTKHGSSSAEGKLYVNGAGAGGTYSDATIANDSSPIKVGYDGFYYCTGSVKDLAIFDRALSAAEIADLYAIATGS